MRPAPRTAGTGAPRRPAPQHAVKLSEGAFDDLTRRVHEEVSKAARRVALPMPRPAAAPSTTKIFAS